MPQEVGLALGARADVGESLLGAQPHGQEIIGADEHRDLAHAQRRIGPLGRLLDSVHHGEQRVLVLLDLRALVALARVLDGKRVERELLLHLVELRRGRLEQRDPDEAIGPGHVLADVLDRNIAELPAVLIGDAVDEHGGRERGRGPMISAPDPWRHRRTPGRPVSWQPLARRPDAGGRAGRTNGLDASRPQ